MTGLDWDIRKLRRAVGQVHGDGNAPFVHHPAPKRVSAQIGAVHRVEVRNGAGRGLVLGAQDEHARDRRPVAVEKRSGREQDAPVLELDLMAQMVGHHRLNLVLRSHRLGHHDPHDLFMKPCVMVWMSSGVMSSSGSGFDSAGRETRESPCQSQDR